MATLFAEYFATLLTYPYRLYINYNDLLNGANHIHKYIQT